MGNPCQSCHGRPETQLGPLTLDLTACPAEQEGAAPFRPLSPSEAQSIEANPAAVRSRFEAARAGLHPEGSRFTLDVPRAALRVEVVPKTFQVALPWGLQLQLKATPQAKVSSQISVSDNAINLGLRSLVEFFQVTLEGPGGLSTTPDRLSVGNYGHLHFLTSVKPELYEKITRDPGKNPSLAQILLKTLQANIPVGFNFSPETPLESFPLGHDNVAPPEECPALVSAQNSESQSDFSTPLPLEYADPQENPKLDFILTALLPPALRSRAEGRVPEQLDLNRLLDLIAEWAQQPKNSDRTLKMFLADHVRLNDGSIPQEWIDLIETGSATLDLAELEDLYIPGIVDLGSSHALAQVKLNPDHSIDFFIQDLSLDLDAMDYLPGKTGQAQIRLHDGQILHGQAYTDPQGTFWYPGIQLHWDATHRTLQIKNNLEVKLHATLPLVGEIQLNSPLQWGSSWQDVGGWHLVPGSSSLQIPQLKIQRLIGGVPQPKQSGEFSILLSDQASSDSIFYQENGQRSRGARPEELITGGGDVEAPSVGDLLDFSQGQDIPHLNTEIRGSWGDSTWHWRGYLPLDLRSPGGIKHYLPLNPKSDLAVHGTLEFSSDTQKPMAIHLDAESFQPIGLQTQTDSNLGFRVNIGVQNHQGKWLVDGARLSFQKIGITKFTEESRPEPSLQCGGSSSEIGESFFTPAQDNTELYVADVSIDRVDVGPLHLEDLRFESEIESSRGKNGAWLFEIPRLKLRANESASPQNPQAGWIAGAVRIEQNALSESPLSLSLDPSTWTMDLKNLNLEVALASLALPKKWQEGQKQRWEREKSNGRTPRPLVSGLGADFRLGGDFQFNLKNLVGTGDLALKGDSDGDIYFHKRNGNRIFPPLRKNTSFRVSDIERVLIKECNAEGHFREFAEWNTKSLSLVGIDLLINTQEALPFKDLPLCMGGITSANEDYYHQLMLSLTTGHYAPFYQQIQTKYEELLGSFLVPMDPLNPQTQEGTP